MPRLRQQRVPRLGALVGAGLAIVLLAACPGGEARLGPNVVGRPSDGLVYVRVDGDGRHDLWRARLSDGATRPLSVTPTRKETWPYWSQAAAQLVFEVRREGARGSTELRLWRAADESVHELPTRHAGGVGWPQWGPRGQQLAYAVHPGENTTGGLAVLDLASGRAEFWAVNRGDLYFVRPAFAPDGEALVSQGTRRKRDARVFLLRPDKPARPLTLPGAYAYRAKFSRDGAWVVFTEKGRDDAPFRIGAVGADGSGLRWLADPPGAHNERVEASPTRDEVAFVSDRDGALDVFRMAFPDGTPINLTPDLELQSGPFYWSPDGERIAVVMWPHAESPHSEWQVVVIDREGHELFRTPGLSPDWMPAWP